MKHYSIHKDFSRYEHMYPPINKLMLPVIHFVSNSLPKNISSNSAVTITKVIIPVNKSENISALLYAPSGTNSHSPCLIYYHGGGFMLEAAPYHYELARIYAEKTPCKLLFVNYRLAPKYPFPIPIKDCFSALKWLINNSNALGIDQERIAVAGDSAGGNLAAVVTLIARERITIPLCGQMLIYPVIDRRMKTQTMKKYTNTPMWNSKLSKKMWKYYLPSVSTKNISFASPLEAETLENLPNAYIETAEFDCLHDEAIQYAAALKKAGIKVWLYQTKGTMHGFDIVLDSNIVKKCINNRIKFLKKIFLEI